MKLIITILLLICLCHFSNSVDIMKDLVNNIVDDIAYELKEDLLEAYDTRMRIKNKLKGFIANALDKEMLNNLMQELPKKPLHDPSSFLNVTWKYVMRIRRLKMFQNYLEALNLDKEDIEDLTYALKSRNKITLTNVFDEIFDSTFTQPLPVEDIRDDVNFFFEDYCADSEDQFINYKKFFIILFSAAFSAIDEKGVFNFEAYLNNLFNELALIDVTLIKEAFSESLELLRPFKGELGSDWDYIQEGHQYITNEDFNDIDYIFIINYLKNNINYFKPYINYINIYINNYIKRTIKMQYSPHFGKSILHDKNLYD